VNPRAGLDDVENRKFLILPGLELQPLGRPIRSQSKHWYELELQDVPTVLYVMPLLICLDVYKYQASKFPAWNS
jgi:hypothetical protein